MLGILAGSAAMLAVGVAWRGYNGNEKQVALGRHLNNRLKSGVVRGNNSVFFAVGSGPKVQVCRDYRGKVTDVLLDGDATRFRLSWRWSRRIMKAAAASVKAFENKAERAKFDTIVAKVI